MTPTLQVVVGGQFGSEAKGHVAGYLAAQAVAPLCIRIAGPNAGHTVINPATGTRHALRQVPVGAVTHPEAGLAIGAGSEIDLEVLGAEISSLELDGIKIRDRLTIDPQATILDEGHRSLEASSNLVALIGSTGKGIGACRADRVMRRAMIIGDMRGIDPIYGTVASARGLASQTRWDLIQIEGTQGYGLGLHAGYYPHCTSSDCTAVDFMSMAQVNPWGRMLEIWIVYRPYPIRVAGSSGPLTGETTWEALGLPPEYTTVTQKLRRVGAWDAKLARAALDANGGPGGPVCVALTMADQLDPALTGSTRGIDLIESDRFSRFASRMVDDLGGAPLSLVTTSPQTCIDLRVRQA